MEVEVSQLLIRYSRILEIIGDIVKVQVPASEAGAATKMHYPEQPKLFC